MTARQQWIIVGVVVAALGGALFAATRLMHEELFPISVGTEAPAFHALPLLEPVYPSGSDTLFASRAPAVAGPHTLEDYAGDVILLNIWATWCDPCREEMPAIERLHRAFGPRGLKVLAVSIDGKGDEGAIRSFVREYGLTFAILHDPEGDIQRIYRTTGVPETFVIARDGIIRKKVIGAADWSSEGNRALVAQLLSEDRP